MERAVASGAPLVQRKCACGGTCERCREEEQRVQRKAASSNSSESVEAAPSAVREVLDSPGAPLDSATRAGMEPLFGRDFSGVRVHTGTQAASSAAAIRAVAYTSGNHLVFGAGRYDPQSSAGRGLIAHELTHVVQQSEMEGRSLQRKPEDAALQCGGTWTCAATPCQNPDPGRTGTGGDPTGWTLKILIDAEAASAADVGPNTVGHTYVEFSNSTGAAWTYGFYPNKSSGTPDPMFHPEVFGCMVHPDTNHAKCVDYIETFTLSKAQFDTAIGFAQLLCSAPPRYNIQTFNCTTFARDVAVKAGKSLPPIRGSVGPSPGVTADNPYTLIEGLRRRDIGPTYNLDSDTDIRNAIAGATPAELSRIPVTEKIRVINRLLDGWVSDEDIQAIETLCNAVSTPEEMAQINHAVHRREGELNDRQGMRFHNAISRTVTKP